MTVREGRLSWEAISYMERERVPKGRGIVTEGISKVPIKHIGVNPIKLHSMCPTQQ